ncbi:MAG: PTS fructose transporter subunit IIA [Betaproteobacteria bacterium]|nr:MAG: PTS fructose transporter subunit IIA [Betaproteobacteria bacterium]TAG46622.1 MAG: PTS fructose transporter subunit IIA [Betaproteobacteria bacterium]
MIGVLIIAHGNFGDSLIGCMTHVLGKRPESISSLQVAGTDSPRDLMPAAQRMIDALDDGEGVLIITDIFGATPSNLASKLLVPGRIEAVAGGNVPMLVRAMTYRTKGMDTLLKRVVAGGCEGVFHMEADPITGPCVAKSSANEGAPVMNKRH